MRTRRTVSGVKHPNCGWIWGHRQTEGLGQGFGQVKSFRVVQAGSWLVASVHRDVGGALWLSILVPGVAQTLPAKAAPSPASSERSRGHHHPNSQPRFGTNPDPGPLLRITRRGLGYSVSASKAPKNQAAGWVWVGWILYPRVMEPESQRPEAWSHLQVRTPSVLTWG